MNAKQLVDQMGQSLVGRTIMTEQIGSFPGGPRKVIGLEPDKGAPDIVIQVEYLEAPDDFAGGKQIGIFEWEEVELL